MKQQILPALKLTLFSFFLLSVGYAAVIWGVAQAAPNQGEGETVVINGRVVGFEKEGQLFTADRYFWSRPSAVDYNGAGSGGSNKGPSNPEYLQQVEARVDTFLAHNPGVQKGDIPSELVTASGSGLDPDLSPAAALIQVKRIASVRGMSETAITKLIGQHSKQPLAGVAGPARVNILRLNIALDELETN